MCEALKPIKHLHGDLFVCDITDVILKDDMPSMEHPFYSLSKKPDREPRRYEHNGNWIEFRPSIKGLPTIYDKDLIIYVISQLVAGKEIGRPLSKTVEIDPYAFLVFTERGTGGRDYDALCDSLDRIDGTRFRTNILGGGKMTNKWMGIIDSAELQTNTRTGKPEKLRITVSDMVLDAVESAKVLTLHRDYFRLRKPLERRIYELGRKHCGRKEQWYCRLETLHKKSGSRGSLREFRRLVKDLVKNDHLPDYAMTMDADDRVTFLNRGTMPSLEQLPSDTVFPAIKIDTEHDARLAAPGYDVQYLKREWWSFWADSGKPALKSPDAAFLAFCRQRYERKPNP